MPAAKLTFHPSVSFINIAQSVFFYLSNIAVFFSKIVIVLIVIIFIICTLHSAGNYAILLDVYFCMNRMLRNE